MPSAVRGPSKPTTGRAYLEIEGLTALNRALRDLDPELQKALRRSLREVATKARDRVRAVMPSRSGKARGSVRVGATSTSAYLQSGKAQVPYVPWLDFGGYLRPSGKRRGTQYRDIIRRGRYLYPTLDRMQPEITREVVDSVRTAARRVGLDLD